MDEMMKKATRAALLFSACCLLVWAAVPEWRTVAAGLVLGLAASVSNTFLLRRRVDWIGKVTAMQGPRKMSLGLAGRLATVLLAVMIAKKYPEQFSMPATLSACFIMPFVTLAYAYFLNKRNS
ncbi:ATP synthase subunit I [Paenibacillus spongiae]|uniref:ATP synthase subunit I n=1 Tax=Paenibacillus spongiae TaxID=2909671 RepID=A0ABY5SCD9_9BACL|nr:ATP synthase subunit I [Paenibacillus spongiae]UVI29953.1 ATP synthase subunit I [Paenibacillus spongiae]